MRGLPERSSVKGSGFGGNFRYFSVYPLRVLLSWGDNRIAVVQMKTADGRCIFYFEDSEGLGGCSVHRARPWRCGQWPLHPAILGDENNLITIRESCPGLNQELPYQEFCSILRELMKKGKIQC